MKQDFVIARDRPRGHSYGFADGLGVPNWTAAEMAVSRNPSHDGVRDCHGPADFTMTKSCFIVKLTLRGDFEQTLRTSRRPRAKSAENPPCY